MEALRETNKFLQEEEPWLRKAEEDKPRRLESVRVCLEALYGVAHLLVAFLPTACTRVFQKIGGQSRFCVVGIRKACALPRLQLGRPVLVWVGEEAN